jgi:hypothetical protein
MYILYLFQVNASITVLLKRMDALRSSYEGKGKETEPILSEEAVKELEELEILLPETEAKLRDLTEALEKEVEGGTIGNEAEVEEPTSVVVNDISNLVKKSSKSENASDSKRKDDDEVPTLVASKKSKLDN